MKYCKQHATHSMGAGHPDIETACPYCDHVELSACKQQIAKLKKTDRALHGGADDYVLGDVKPKITALKATIAECLTAMENKGYEQYESDGDYWYCGECEERQGQPHNENCTYATAIERARKATQ